MVGLDIAHVLCLLSTRMPHASPPRELLSLGLRHRDRQHRIRPLLFYHNLGVLQEGRCHPIGGDHWVLTGLSPVLRGRGARRPTTRATSTWWTGRGARWKGRLVTKIWWVLSSGSVFPVDQFMFMSMSLPSKLALRSRWFISRTRCQIILLLILWERVHSLNLSSAAHSSSAARTVRSSVSVLSSKTWAICPGCLHNPVSYGHCTTICKISHIKLWYWETLSLCPVCLYVVTSLKMRVHLQKLLEWIASSNS